MGRLDWKEGKFDADYETLSMQEGMEGYRSVYGDYLWYFRFNDEASEMDPVYDEAAGNGRVYSEPLKLDAMHVVHVDGENEYGEYGMYHNDTVSATISYNDFVLSGLTFADIQNGNYLDDRVLYDRKIFRVTQLLVRGQIQQRDTIVALRGSQMKPDELVDDPQFAEWSLGGPNDLTGEN